MPFGRRAQTKRATAPDIVVTTLTPPQVIEILRRVGEQLEPRFGRTNAVLGKEEAVLFDASTDGRGGRVRLVFRSKRDQQVKTTFFTVELRAEPQNDGSTSVIIATPQATLVNNAIVNFDGHETVRVGFLNELMRADRSARIVQTERKVG